MNTARVAVISDIHGNAFALEAVLRDIASQGAELIVCLGDIAAFGPQPQSVIEQLQGLACPIVMGNTDEFFAHLDVMRQQASQSDEMRRNVDILVWNAAGLRPDALSFLQSLPGRLELALTADTRMLLCHASPDDNTRGVGIDLPDDAVLSLLDGSQPAIFATGHTHRPMMRTVGRMLVVNPGSVGLPMMVNAQGQLRRHPWAEYALIDAGRGPHKVSGCELRRVPYDVSAVTDAARAAGMPHADWWCARWD